MPLTVYQISLATLSQPLIVLYSDTRHASEDPEAIFAQAASLASAPDCLIADLMERRFESNSGTHRRGDRIYLVQMRPEACHRKLTATFDAPGQPPTVQIAEGALRDLPGQGSAPTSEELYLAMTLALHPGTSTGSLASSQIAAHT